LGTLLTWIDIVGFAMILAVVFILTIGNVERE